MIGVEGQSIIRISIGDKEDFIEDADLLEFTLIEEAGNVLPTYKIDFLLTDTSVKNLLNEGNIVEFSWGRSQKELLKDTSLRILHSISTKAGDKWRIVITGLLDALAYINDCKAQTTSAQSGVAALTSAVGNHFEIDANITESEDSQNWIQYNIPDKKFVSELWMHSDLSNSFLGLAISSSGKFIIRDMAKTMGEDPRWKFVSKSSGGLKRDEIQYNPDYVYDADTALINQWMGYGRSKSIRDLDEGTDSILSVSPDVMMSNTNKLSRADNVGTKYGQFGLLNDNVHSKFWESYLNNLSHLTTFSTNKIIVSYDRFIHDINLLDLVSFEDTEINSAEQTEHYSGRYIVGKIGRTFQNKSFSTILELNREASGNMKGDLL